VYVYISDKNVLVLGCKGVKRETEREMERDDIQAEQWLELAVQKNDMNAKLILSRVLLHSIEEKRSERALQLVHDVARENVPEALFQLGQMSEYGLGGEASFTLAEQSYTRAAEAGHTEATYYLGLMYAYGRKTIAQDFSRAISLFERCAREAYAPCMYLMGVMKMSGAGTQTDYRQAVRWFERAAGMDDMRVTERAREAANELTQLLEEAEKYNSDVVDGYRRRSDEH